MLQVATPFFILELRISDPYLCVTFVAAHKLCKFPFEIQN